MISSFLQFSSLCLLLVVPVTGTLGKDSKKATSDIERLQGIWVANLEPGLQARLRPKREHTLYGGIYTRIRYPQAVAEFPLWWVLGFLAHSPFLALFSFAFVPVWYYFCVAEERDLLIRYGAAYNDYRETTGFWLPRRMNDHT